MDQMTIKNPFSIAIRNTIPLVTVLCFSISTQKNKPMDKGHDISILSDSATLTKGDYLIHLEKVFETVNKVPVTIGSFKKLNPIAAHLTQDEVLLPYSKIGLHKVKEC